MKSYYTSTFILLILLLVLSQMFCTSPQNAGTGSETDVGSLAAGVYGTLVNSMGTPVQNVKVVLIEINDTINLIPIDSTYTDSKGFYNLTDLETGNYYLEGSIEIDTSIYKTSIDSIHYDKFLYDSIGLNLGYDTLQLPGYIKGSVSIYKEDKTGVLVFIPGTSYSAYTDSLGAFIISGLPADSGYTLIYSYEGYLKETESPITVNPKDTTTIPQKVLTYDPNLTPPPPIGLGAKFDSVSGTVTINWDKINHPGLGGYVIYRKNSAFSAEDPEKISGDFLIPDTNTSYVDTIHSQLFTGDTVIFQYQIRSQHKETGNRSEFSQPVFVKTPPPLIDKVDLILHFPLNGEVKDEGPLKINTTVTDLSFENSSNYKYAIFNGTSSYFTCDDNPALNIGDSSFTVTFWVSTLKEDGLILSKHAGPVGQPETGWNIWAEDGPASIYKQGIRMDFSDGKYGHWGLVDCNGEGTDDTWHHYGFVVDREEGKIKLYLDGEFISVYDIKKFGSARTTANFTVGYRSGFTFKYFKGKLADLRVYKSAKSINDVKFIMNTAISVKD